MQTAELWPEEGPLDLSRAYHHQEDRLWELVLQTANWLGLEACRVLYQHLLREVATGRRGGCPHRVVVLTGGWFCGCPGGEALLGLACQDSRRCAVVRAYERGDGSVVWARPGRRKQKQRRSYIEEWLAGLREAMAETEAESERQTTTTGQ